MNRGATPKLFQMVGGAAAAIGSVMASAATFKIHQIVGGAAVVAGSFIDPAAENSILHFAAGKGIYVTVEEYLCYSTL